MTSRLARLVVVALIATAAVVVGLTASRAGASSPQQSTITLRGASYTPYAAAGGTDDYHCTLMNPHLTKSGYIVKAHFFPNSIEVHHAILFLIPPNLAAQALADNKGNKGWSCFGESALPGSVPLNEISNTPWLTAWAPGHGQDVEPAGTGVWLPKGSLVVEQIHYNLLRGDKPVQAKLQLTTVPASTPLQALNLDLRPAPPDVPCPATVSGPLCSRTASLADLANRFGPWAATFDNIIEQACGRDPANPPSGDTTSCTWPIGGNETIVRLGAHMHLTGRSLTITLDPGTPRQQVLLDVKNFNFDYQRSYTLAHPVMTHAGDTVQISCTYDPTLRQELPQLRKLPARYVVWGDGSSDEMCLGLIQTVKGAYKP